MNDVDNPVINWDEVRSLVKSGFKPSRRMVKNNEYIVLYKGNQSRSLGRFTEENWEKLMNIVEEVESGIEPAEKEEGFDIPITIPEPSEDFLPIDRAAEKAGVRPEEVTKLLRSGELVEGRDFRREKTEDGTERYVVNWRSVKEVLTRPFERALDAEYERRLIRLKGSIMSELRDMLREFEERLMRYVDERTSKAVVTSEVTMKVPTALMPSARLNLNPKIVFYYSYIADQYKRKTGKSLTIQEFINAILEEHCEDCLGLYTALGREMELSTRGE
ncbi:MAG: hypothetical protein QXT14_02790 [Candidatus Bathyarchaeia archaeon]